MIDFERLALGASDALRADAEREALRDDAQARAAKGEFETAFREIERTLARLRVRDSVSPTARATAAAMLAAREMAGGADDLDALERLCGTLAMVAANLHALPEDARAQALEEIVGDLLRRD